MGGKGGGGNDQQMYYYMMQQQQERQAKDAADLASEQARLKDIADKAAVKPPEPEAPKVEEPAPAPEAPKPVEALGPAVGGGGFIDQPGGNPKGPLGPGSVTDTGETLGGSILNPPSYWAGKVNQYKTAPASMKKVGSQTNTET